MSREIPRLRNRGDVVSKLARASSRKIIDRLAIAHLVAL
jgi:hypothetical protein